MKNTKLVCTIGPSCLDEVTLKRMIENGMDVVRINMSHASHSFAEEIIQKIRKLNIDMNRNVGILIDTKGPEIRIGDLGVACVRLIDSQQILLSPKPTDLSKGIININERTLSFSLDIDNLILIDDGNIKLVVVGINNEDIICRVLEGGILKSNKGVNVPNCEIQTTFLSDQDKNDILFASRIGVDYIALSFVRNSNDVLDVNDILISERNEHTQIISKIECKSAIDDIDDIIKVSDGIMVARGDLGVEIELEKVPCVQKNIIKKVRNKGKLCIVATEMLASMETKQRPTRAEVSDVANAVIDGVDAVMLSGETAIGSYPIETVKTMFKIIEETEKSLDHHKILNDCYEEDNSDTTSVLAYSTVEAANMLKVKAIVVTTISGYTARRVSNYRPNCPIIAVTPIDDTATSLSLSWGVIPVIIGKCNSTDEIINVSTEIAKNNVDLNKNDKIIITGGFPFEEAKTTNFMKVEEIN